MRDGSIWRLVLTALLASGLGAVAAALPAPVQGGAPLSTLFYYADMQGSGCLTVASQGEDPVSGGTVVAVSLTRGDAMLFGQGEEWVITAAAPRTLVLAFFLSDGSGSNLFFAGTLGSGSEGSMAAATQHVQGQWTNQQDATVSNQWQAFEILPPRPCTSIYSPPYGPIIADSN